MGKKIEIKVTVKNLVAKGLDSAKRSLARFRSVAGGVMKGVGVAAKGAAVAFGLLGLAIRKSFQFEAYRTQFATLLGSMTAAKARFKELVEISERTPFSPKQIVEASKSLEAFGFKGAENTKMLLKMGDAAAAMDPTKMFEMVRAMGRLKAGASAGIVGEPSLRLLELGLITAETKNKMEEVAKATKSSAAVIAVASKDLDRFNGGMERLANTGSGLFSTFLGKIDVGLATFGDSLLELSKETLRDANKAIEDFTKSDRFKDWADKTGAALTVVKDIISDLFGGDKGKRLGALDDIKSIFVGAMSAAVDVLLQGAAMAAQIMKEAVLSGPTGKDEAVAMSRLKSQGKLGAAAGKFHMKQSPMNLLTGDFDRKFTSEQLELIRAEAKKVQRERLASGMGGLTPQSSLPERFDTALAGIKGSKKSNADIMADMMNGFSEFGIDPSKVPTTPASSTGGGALSTGDLFARFYGSGGGKPDGSAARPLNITIAQVSGPARKVFQYSSVVDG